MSPAGQFREPFWHTWPAGRTRRVLALLVAVSVPVVGAGLIVVGRPWRAMFWLTLSVLGYALMVLWPIVVLVSVLIWVASIVDAGISAAPASRTRSNWKTAGGLLLFVVFGFSLRLVERSRLVEPYHIPSEGMRPTLLDGDDIVVDRRKISLSRGDIIVFTPPSDLHVDLVKRVVALPGDTVSLQEGLLRINGQDVGGHASPCDALELRHASIACFARSEQLSPQQKYVALYAEGVRVTGSVPLESGQCPSGMEFTAQGCLVPAGHVFVMGDNRDDSFDSRLFGPLERGAVKGRVKGIYFSYGDGSVRWKRVGLTLL